MRKEPPTTFGGRCYRMMRNAAFREVLGTKKVPYRIARAMMVIFHHGYLCGHGAGYAEGVDESPVPYTEPSLN